MKLLGLPDVGRLSAFPRAAYTAITSILLRPEAQQCINAEMSDVVLQEDDNTASDDPAVYCTFCIHLHGTTTRMSVVVGSEPDGVDVWVDGKGPILRLLANVHGAEQTITEAQGLIAAWVMGGASWRVWHAGRTAYRWEFWCADRCMWHRQRMVFPFWRRRVRVTVRARQRQDSVDGDV